MDIDWIREGLKKPGKTQKGLAEALRLDPAQVTRILKNGRRLRADELDKVREYLESAAAPSLAARDLPVSRTSMPRDVPVKGSGACGPDGIFEFNSGPIDYVRRPPRFFGLGDIYALYVGGDSMSPWRENGDLVYVNPNQPPRLGDYVVVQLQPIGPGTAPAAYIKRLMKRGASEIIVAQFNPKKEIPIPTKKVGLLHRIVDWTELMGV